MKNECVTCNNCRIAVNFGTTVAHDKPIPDAKQNFEISTDVIKNAVIMSKFECFHQKSFNFKRLYHSSLWMERIRNGSSGTGGRSLPLRGDNHHNLPITIISSYQ